MTMRDTADIEVRAHYEHYSSRPDKRKVFVTLGFRATAGEIDVMYMPETDHTKLYYRSLQEFGESVSVGDTEVPRFMLIERDAITTEERDALLNELDEDY